MKVLITGGAGFLGTRLAHALLKGAGGLPRVSMLVSADVTKASIDDSRVHHIVGSIADAEFVGSMVDSNVDVIYHLAAVLSGQSEADFDLGMRVNVDATRGILEACRRLRNPPRFIFTSTVAVFGGGLPAIVPEEMVPRPQSSYGAEKSIAEILVNEYSRKGFVDGIACRVPTVAVRPGAPNSALSSFVSGIIREPLTGIDTVCPVPLETRLWICSPDVLTSNLLHAARIDTSALGVWRTLNLPGLTVTPAQMLDSLTRLGGAAARARVSCRPNPDVVRVVATWPAALDASRALRLGFTGDRDVDSIVQQFIDQRSIHMKPAVHVEDLAGNEPRQR